MKLQSEVATTMEPWFPSPLLGRARIVTGGPICWFVRAVLRRGALTFSPFIFFGKTSYDAKSLASLALLAHELKHLEQYQEYGRLRFLLRYFWDLARNRFRYSRDLPLEADAYRLGQIVRDALKSDLT